MARTIKNPVVVTMSKRVAEGLFLTLTRATDCDRLAGIVGNDIDNQVGPNVTLELTRKDALTMHRAALNARQIDRIDPRTYSVIEKAFRDAYDARLRRSVGE